MEAKDWERMRIYAEENGLMKEDLGKVANDFREHMRRGGLNKHVPTDVLIKYERYQCERKYEKQIEALNKQLDAKKAMIENLCQRLADKDKELKQKEAALENKVAEAYNYWLDKAVDYAASLPSHDDVELLRRFIGSSRKLRKAFNKFYAYVQNAQEYKQALEERGQI